MTPHSPETREHATVVVSRRVRPGCESAFKTWADGFATAMEPFPGHVRSQLVPPVGQAQPEWVFVFTFDSAASLQAWVSSEVRTRWLKDAEGLVEGVEQAQVISGLEALFGILPPTVAPPPPVWKVAVSVLVGLYPTSLLNALFLAPHLAGWPLPLRVLASVLVLVACMTWIVMPFITRLLKPWLYPGYQPGTGPESSR